ncbi:nitronate monooxygenase [Ilumatobacter nonamiensis]|uniref:nitronate monooxygenase n=1 Tax=Ilumatobacter nonamiensis TaxID=467093 RepID=UPI0005914841
MKTAVTEMLDIEFPIFAFSHCRDVVAAVSKAGGLGVLGAVAHTPEQLEIDLGWIEDEVGGKPYGVDLIVPAKYAGDDDGGYTLDDIAKLIPDTHREFIDDILARYDVPELPDGDDTRATVPADGAGGSAPFSAKQAMPLLDIALAHDTAFVANALGPPPQFLIDRCKEEGKLIGALAGRPQHAERHQAAGVDIIIAQGSEAGGHTGEIGSMVLIPEIVDAVDIPVLGAGGIGRGRQMAAAMALGAQGVWCGSVWLTTDEAETHPVVKQKFLAATSADTIRSRSLTGKHARMLKSKWTEEWERADTPDPLGMPLQPILTNAAQRRIARAAHTPGSGAEELSNYFVGQIVGNMNQPKSAATVVMEMIEEFIDATESLAKQLEV